MLAEMVTELLHSSEARLRVEIQSSEEKLRGEIRSSEGRTNDQLQLAVEIIKSEALGAHSDKTAIHDDVLLTTNGYASIMLICLKILP